MRIFRIFLLWIKNAFIFKSPILSHLEYVDYIAEGKSYVVLSWKMEHAYQLRIISARFESVSKSGSAYMLLPKNIVELDIVISSSWRTQKYLIKLKQIVIDDTIEFPVAMLTSFDAKLNIPDIKTKFSKLKMSSFKAKIVEIKPIKTIINISYPN